MNDVVNGPRRWPKVVAGLGWFLAAVAIHATAKALLQLAFDAVGMATIATESTNGDPRNPPGEYLAAVGAVVAAVLGVVVLHRWYRSPAAVARAEESP